jgi:hypothetical protein
LFAHVVALYPNAVEMVGDAIGRLARGQVLAQETQSGGNYYTYPTAAEWEDFLRRGWRVADPTDLWDVFARYR